MIFWQRQPLAPEWYGRMKIDGGWKWFKLFTDRRASQNRWNDIIKREEQKAAGVTTPAMEHIDTPIEQHKADYLKALKPLVSPEHHAIVTFMLDKLIAETGWKRLCDLSSDSLRSAVEQIKAKGRTTSYANKFISSRTG
ncbi:MAG: hypothetical protein H7Z14_14350 [Anaerolineae bacterium]|nr:hypothetical protein [Phycisphaerae bacterium]